FSRENVGGEITATISDEGIYLSSSAEWLVWAEGTMAVYELAIDTPAGFETVTQGERTLHQETENGLHTRWVTTHPSDGLNLIANRYFVHEEPVREGVISQTFFLEDDARLRATYMERTRAYITMYEEMIGPYPYTKFATVENWFPTGYGMPSYTLLGGQVLRLPFIPYTSFGHEIAHNWWGNSVFVDLDEGNWCEGLTVYCADYHYKELESADAAREYRRNTLKDYAAYVKDPAHDFPLSEFHSRHSGATRAVGYGKSMMVFHMASRMIGRDNFLNSLRIVAADHQYTEAAWSDFMGTFATAGERDLTVFQEQWLARTGAPVLSLGEVEFQDDKVQIEIRQESPTYALEVPVVVTTSQGSEEHIVKLAGESGQFSIAGPNIRQVAVDPDYQLFRRLHPQEIEATISQVLAEAEPVIVMGEGSPRLQAAGQSFAVDFAEDEEAHLLTDGQVVPGGHTNVLLNPDSALLQTLSPPELQVAGKMIFLGGKRYDRAKYDLVFAAADPDDPATTHLVVLCDSPQRLGGLASRVSHYGKYSWLVLPVGSGRPDRGNWQPGESPLVASENAKK
ncbi:MAG: M1 family aminopeptidase, partial [Candidatus Krumholzibacteria bacterium]|nr:M1 family aminopeptidase [Candidatus Krumholzibacteria bacterium]